ncbi:MAG: ModD protein [Hyphomicrobiaceae bacterium]
MSAKSDEELLRILSEDCPFADLTTEGLGIGDVPATASFTARNEMVVCGSEDAERMMQLAGAATTLAARSGETVAAGTLILQASGSARQIHHAYKMAQTLMEILSGMSTATRAIVDAARAGNPRCRVACTRKHMPGLKRWAVRAIEAGGAAPHRLGLSDYVLVFAEHRTLLDGSQTLGEHFARLAASTPERRLAAEAGSFDEAVALAQAGAEIVQVDKMSPDEVAAVATRLQAMPMRPLLAAAGGINPSNAQAYAAAGADLLVTSQPYYAPPRDVKVAIRRA